MSWGIVASVGAAVVGGAMSSSASKKAGQMQADSADRATQAEREMFERQVELQEPWRQAGGLGLNRLSYLLGLSPTGTFTPGETGQSGTGTAAAPATAETRDQILARLSPQYLTQMPVTGAPPGSGAEGDGGSMVSTGPTPLVNRLDEVSLNAAVDAEFAKQQQAAKAAQAQTNALATSNAAKDPSYGSLLRNFGMADFQKDPGYQFRMDEGQKALDRAAAAGGRFNSGRAMKDITRFGQGLASEEYGNAYNRFNTNQDKTFNRLASLAGVGQSATNQVSNAAGQLGGSVANNIIGAGNAQAAGRIGSGNAWSGALGQAGSMYQQNQLLNSMRGPNNYGQAMFSNTGLGSSGFGTGLAYGNQDFGQYI